MNIRFVQATDGLSQPQGEERLLAWLSQLQSSSFNSSDAGWFVAGILAATSSRRLRNAAALALVDMKASAAAEVILDVLRNPSLAQEAGTLLYALDELGVKLPLDVLLIAIEHGSYEARATALQTMEDRGLASLEATDLERARAKLDLLAGSDRDPEQAEAARIARDFLALA